MTRAIRIPRVRRIGFTLIELLIVMAIVGILVALLLPALGSVREAARRAKCKNNVKQLALALQSHHESKGAFPPGVLNNSGEMFAYPRTTWCIYLLPYLEQDNLFDQFKFDAAPGAGDAVWTNPVNCMGADRLTNLPLAVWLCPSDDGTKLHHHPNVGADFARGNYAGFFGNLDMGATISSPPVSGHLAAVFAMNDRVQMARIRDGASNTMAIGECLRGVEDSFEYRGVYWYDHVGNSEIFTKFPPNSKNPDVLYPTWCPPQMNLPAQNLPCVPGSSSGLDNTASSRSRHPGGVQVGMADGSAQFISNNVDLAVWQSMGSINGDETQ